MSLRGICTWSCLQPLFVPREWERWDGPRVFLFLCLLITSTLCGNTLCTMMEGHGFWPLALVLQVSGFLALAAGSLMFWQVMRSCTGRRLQVAFDIHQRLHAHNRMKEVLQTCILTCIGTGAIASVKHSGFLDVGSASSNITEQFCQSFAQVIAAFVVTSFGLFAFRNIVLFNFYRAAVVVRREYARTFIKPMQISVPDLSKEAPGECSVCLISLADDEGKGCMRLFCNHTFHVSCIKSWLDIHERCPLCRESVTTWRACVLIKQKETAASGPPASSPAISDASTAVPADSSHFELFDIESGPTESSHASPGLEIASPLQVADGPRDPLQAAMHVGGEQMDNSEIRLDTQRRRSPRRREKSKKRKPAKPQVSAHLQSWSEQPTEAPVDLQLRNASRSSGESQSSARSLSSEESLDSQAELRDIRVQIRGPPTMRGPGASFDQVVRWAEEGALTPPDSD